MMVGAWKPTAGGGACCAIIAEPASDCLAQIHVRNPLVLEAGCRWDWLEVELTEREDTRTRTI